MTWGGFFFNGPHEIIRVRRVHLVKELPDVAGTSVIKVLTSFILELYGVDLYGHIIWAERFWMTSMSIVTFSAPGWFSS